MGPRSDERGNLFNSAMKCRPTLLQWGRARMSAEICCEAHGHFEHHKASMGPRSDERGNTVRSRAIAWYFSMLQWGRARMSAEINPIVSGGLEGLRASMGPRSDERGNVFSSAECRRAWACFNGAALG